MQKIRDNAALSTEKATILKKLKALGEEVDEEYLKDYPDCQENAENDASALHARFSEISMLLEDNNLFIAEEERK